MKRGAWLILLLAGGMPVVYGQVDTTALSTEKAETSLPTVNISGTDLDNDEQIQDISGLLQSSDDIFNSTAGYSFGAARFRVRGFDSENSMVMVNGVPLNDMETGRVYYGRWGGLNDAFRNTEIETGINASRHSFGGIGGISNMIVRASLFRKQTKLTWSLSNRTYRNRLMMIYSTGLMKNKWAVTASASRRWSQQGYVEGTFYDAWGYFLSVERKINNRHSLGLVAYGSPSQRGQSGISTQEAYDLAGSNYYNPYWGYQNGEVRNSRVAAYHQPMFILSHYWDPLEKMNVTSSLSFSFGRGGTTALEWYDAADPRPDYYRNLPSYYQDEDPATAARYHNWWTTDEEFRQVDWDFFYFANRKNLFTMENVDGIEGNNVTGMLAKYIVEERRNDYRQLKANSSFENRLTEHMTLSGGMDMTWYKGYRYKTVKDLLGGDFYIDVDKFAERDFIDPIAAQNDLRHPNRLLREDDRFGYDYVANINDYSVFLQPSFKYPKSEFYFAGTIGYNEFWRTGNMQNGKFPDDSYGDSEKQSFMTYGLKGGYTYKFTGRHFAGVNVVFIGRSPYFWNAYVSPRTRDYAVSGLTTEKVMAADASYIYRSPYLKSRITVYWAQFTDQVYARSFYHEELNSFVNYLMTGVDKLHYGIEIGAEGKLTQTLELTGVVAVGDYTYSSRPLATITQDNNSELLAENRRVYLKNYKVGGMPQTAVSGGVKYNSPKYWFAGLDVNYFDDIYLDPNPDRRTEAAMEGLVTDDPQWNAVLDQIEQPNGYTVNLFCGKSWIVKGHYIGVTLNVSNILDNQDLVVGGYEQFRYEQKDINKFPPKYYYLYGRTYFLNLAFRI